MSFLSAKISADYFVLLVFVSSHCGPWTQIPVYKAQKSEKADVARQIISLICLHDLKDFKPVE